MEGPDIESIRERRIRPEPESSPLGGQNLAPQVSGYKFAKDVGFSRDVKRRVATYFERTGLSPKADARMYAKTTALLVWFAGSYVTLVFAASGPWQVLLCSVSLAFAMAGIAFSVQHDANHGAYAESALVNRLAGLMLDMLGGSSYIWQFKHNVAHHTYTHLSGADGDIDVPLGRLCAGQSRERYHRFQQIYLWFVYACFVGYWHFFEDFKQVVQARVANHRFPRPRRWRLVEMIAGKLAFFGWAFGVPMLVHPWWAVLGVYAFTSALLSFILILVFQLAHSVEEAALPHPEPGGRVERPWAVHQVEATANFAQSNRLLSWYIGGLNFQIEHHLFPRVCHVHYPRIARIVEQTCAEFGVRYTVHRSCMGAVRSHFRWLRRMGQAS